MIGLYYLNLVLARKDYSLMKVKDLDDLLLSPIEKDVARVIREHWQQYGQVPDVATVLRKVPEFEVYEVSESPEALLHEMREQRLATVLAPVIRQAAKLYETDAVASVNYLKEQLGELAKLVVSNTQLYDYASAQPIRIEEYQERVRMSQEKGLIGIPTGFPGLDRDTQGWWPSHLNIIGGRTNEGKTWLALRHAAVAWQHGYRTAIWSLESSRDEVSYRLDSILGHFSNMALYAGKLSEDEYRRWLQFLEDLKRENPLYIIENGDNGGRPWTPDDIARVVDEYKLDLAVIDQASLLDDGKGKRTIRERYVQVATDCKRRAEDTNIPWILLVQVNREGAKSRRSKEDSPPELETISESDALAQFADRGILIAQVPPLMKLALRKNRFGPKNVEYVLKWQVDTGVIEEMNALEMGADAF